MRIKRRLHISENTIINICFGLILVAIQITFGQILGIGIIILLTSYVLAQRMLGRKVYINARLVLLLFLWISVTLSVIKPSYLITEEAIIEIGWLSFGVLVLFLCCFGLNVNKEKLRNIIIVTTICCATLTLIGYIFSNDIFGLINLPYAGTRIVGGFDGPNEIGSFSVIMLAYIIGWYVFDKYNKKTMWVTALFLIIIIILSWSRGALLGLFFIIFTIMILGCIKWIKEKNYKTIILFVLLSIMLICAVDNFILPQYEIVRANKQSRTYIFLDSAEVIQQKPLVGWGAGAYEHIAKSGDIDIIPHNEFLYFLVAGGIIGLIEILLFFFIIIVLCLKKSMYAELFALLTFLTQELTFNHLIRGRVSFLFWIIITIVVNSTSFGTSNTHNSINSSMNDESTNLMT